MVNSLSFVSQSSSIFLIIAPAFSMAALKECVVGVLALQGAFREHIQMLNSLPGVKAHSVRTAVRFSLRCCLEHSYILSKYNFK